MERLSLKLKVGILLSFLTVGLLLPTLVQACPLCFASSPFRSGLIVATFVLFPLPFILVGLFAYWIIRDSKANS